MAVYQVEQYYISIDNNVDLENMKKEIEEVLSDEGLSDYEFQEDNKTLFIDGFESESEAEQIEDKIQDMLS